MERIINFTGELDDELGNYVVNELLDITDMDEKEGKIKGLAKGVSNFTKLIPILLKKHKEDRKSVV